MTSRPQGSIRLTGLAGFSLALALGGCSGGSTPGTGQGGGAGGGGAAGGGGNTSAGGTVATGGGPATGITGGTGAAGGSIQPAGGSTTAGGTSGVGGVARGGSTATGGLTAAGGTTVAGGNTATGGVTATGGRIGGATDSSAADAGVAGGSTATGGRTGGATASGGSTPAGGITATAGNTGGSRPAGGTTSVGGSASGGSTTSGDAGLPSDTSDFRCVNWADTGDNFQNGVLQPSGLSAASDTYDTVKAKSDAILSGFQTLLEANTVRIPINEPTVVTNAAWWTAYKGIIDSAISKNMKVIIGYWAINGGTLADPNAFYTMWQTVIDAYVGNDLVYFEIMNEPYAMQPPDFINFAVQWLGKYPNVPKSRVIIAGNYTDTDVNQQGADSRLAGCLLSLHVYNYQTTAVVEQPWRDYLKTHVGSNYGRTIATEYGAVMTTGIDYSSAASLPHTPDPTPAINIAYMTGIPNQMREWKMGSCLWVGLRNNDTTSITKLNGTGTDLSLTVTNDSAVARIKWGWGL